MTREEASLEWQNAQWESGCSCHLNPPCGFCVSGFSLDEEEYLDLYGPWDDELVDPAHEAFDRAMEGL